MDENLLIAACKRGESWACKEIYENYAPLMMSVCLRYVNDRETARDLLQDGFIKVFTKINDYAGSGSLGGWIRRIFVTTSLEYLRNMDALKLSVSIDEPEVIPPFVNESVLDCLSADELLECVSGLPNGYRTVFNLFAIEGFSHKEIAEILQISEITSRTQFVRARNVLQKKVLSLMDEGNARQIRK